jgi:hypothetical protein
VVGVVAYQASRIVRFFDVVQNLLVAAIEIANNSHLARRMAAFGIIRMAGERRQLGA